MNLILKDDFNDILENPDQYPEEVISAGIDSIRKLSRQIYDAKSKLEKNLISRMENDGATKLSFIDAQGDLREITLAKGTMKADNILKDKYNEAGFDELEIGDYVFKASWSKAKKAIKFGGNKKQIIEAYFVEGSKSLKLEGAK